MSCAAAAEAVSPTASTAGDADCTDDEAPGQSNMLCTTTASGATWP